MELGNNLKELEEYLLSKGFVIDEVDFYNYENYEFFMVIDGEFKYIDFYLTKYSEIKEEDNKEEFILTFYNEFNSKDLAKLKTIISVIMNN